MGGFDFHRNQFNHVTQGWRQPGSSFKPFIYAAAIDHGVMPETLINDMPLDNVGDWTPANSDDSTDGPVSLIDGLKRSKNLAASGWCSCWAHRPCATGQPASASTRPPARQP